MTPNDQTSPLPVKGGTVLFYCKQTMSRIGNCSSLGMKSERSKIAAVLAETRRFTGAAYLPVQKPFQRPVWILSVINDGYSGH